MKKFYVGVAIALFLTILAVLFVPGVDDFVEPFRLKKPMTLRLAIIALTPLRN